MQSGGILGALIQCVVEARHMTRLKRVKREAKGVVKQVPLTAKNAAVYHANKKLNESNKTFTPRNGSEITLTNTAIKHIIKVIKSF